MKNQQLLPRALALTTIEQNELASLTKFELSAMQFWRQALSVRGIAIPAGKVLMMLRNAPGKYRLEWHPKRLGPLAIAQGEAYRQFTERKDKEFADKLQRRGQEVWT